MICAGIDAGSRAIKVVLMDASRDEVERRYGPHLLRRPDPLMREHLADVRRRLGDALERVDELRRNGYAITGPLLTKLALLDEAERQTGPLSPM